MKEITILVDDDVDYIDIKSVYGSMVVADLYDTGFNELDIWNVRIHRQEKKKSNIAESIYNAIGVKNDKK